MEMILTAPTAHRVHAGGGRRCFVATTASPSPWSQRWANCCSLWRTELTEIPLFSEGISAEQVLWRYWGTFYLRKRLLDATCYSPKPERPPKPRRGLQLRWAPSPAGRPLPAPLMAALLGADRSAAQRPSRHRRRLLPSPRGSSRPRPFPAPPPPAAATSSADISPRRHIAREAASASSAPAASASAARPHSPWPPPAGRSRGAGRAEWERLPLLRLRAPELSPSPSPPPPPSSSPPPLPPPPHPPNLPNPRPGLCPPAARSHDVPHAAQLRPGAAPHRGVPQRRRRQGEGGRGRPGGRRPSGRAGRRREGRLQGNAADPDGGGAAPGPQGPRGADRAGGSGERGRRWRGACVGEGGSAVCWLGRGAGGSGGALEARVGVPAGGTRLPWGPGSLAVAVLLLLARRWDVGVWAV